MKFIQSWQLRLPSMRKRAGFGGGSQTSQSTGSTTPWSGQQPYLTDLFGSAQNQYQNYTPQYYGFQGTAGGTPTQTGGSTVAPFNPTETAATGQIANLGLNGTTGLTNAANTANTIQTMNPNNTPGNSALNQYASGSMLSAGNPYFQSMANQVQSSMLPGMMSAFTQGSTDNPNVAFAASQGMGNALGGLGYQNYLQGQQNQLAGAQGLASNYNTNIGNQLNAASASPYLYNTQLAGANSALSAGQAQQTQAQNELQNQVAAYNYYQTLPYSQINQYSNLIGGQYGSTSTGSTTSPSQSFFGSLFSDERLKKNIKRIGVADNGLPIVSFQYINDPSNVTHIGFLAQDVVKVRPEAVTETPLGLMVDYSLAVA
jgi:hypothetical protein